jgi:hypothetical protein
MGPQEGNSASLPPEIQFTANEALANMLAIEKCDQVVMNPLFGSGLPYSPKVTEGITCAFEIRIFTFHCDIYIYYFYS